MAHLINIKGVGSTRWHGSAMQNGGSGWSLQGPDPCAVGAGEADPKAGGVARIAGDDEEGRSAASRAGSWHPRLLGRGETRRRGREEGTKEKRCGEKKAGARRSRAMADGRGRRREGRSSPEPGDGGRARETEGSRAGAGSDDHCCVAAGGQHAPSRRSRPGLLCLSPSPLAPLSLSLSLSLSRSSYHLTAVLRLQEQPWMLRVQGVQGRFGVVPSQAPAIPHLSRRSASRLFSSVAGRFPRRYRKRGSNNSVQQQQHLQEERGPGEARGPVIVTVDFARRARFGLISAYAKK
ncbi:uncharacterized protein [Triticum aestivum]|uniref:uncharacterized protein isoform X2 n=1 Tax=Triticum aestivum TaxID=4565 RepID=UPI001D012139|nr:uncharacterized protein LOC123069140 isoform X2 [Triticum aestivum]